MTHGMYSEEGTSIDGKFDSFEAMVVSFGLTEKVEELQFIRTCLSHAAHKQLSNFVQTLPHLQWISSRQEQKL
jgi:hypothetical protein